MAIVHRLRSIMLGLAVISAFSAAAPAIAHEVTGRHAKATACSDPAVLKLIGSRFRTLAREVHHDDALAIDTISNVHQHRFMPAREDRPIARRYCGGTVHLNDGRKRTLWYLVEGGMGFAGFFGDGVTFCVSGFDRWNAHNSGCRVLR